MQRVFKDMADSIKEFIEQPDYPTLILNTSDADVLFPTKVLQDMDRQSESEIYLIFPYACDNVRDYIQACMDLIAAQVESVNTERVRQKLDPWPPLPLMSTDPRQLPFGRFRSAVDYIRQLVPADIPIIWSLLPDSIDDTVGYRDFVSPLLATNGFEDWMTGHRFFVRDRVQDSFLLDELEQSKADTVLVLDIDFSSERVADHLVRTVNDARKPLQERIQALEQVAAFDVAYQRYDNALEKYDLLYSYHLESNNVVGQALALSGAGDVALKTDDNFLAKKRYQQALAIAVPDGNMAVLLQLFLGAGEASLRLKYYDNALGYFNFAKKISGKMTNPFCKADVMEKMGVIYMNQEQPDKAIEIWMSGKALCQKFEYEERRISILDKLIVLYSDLGKSKEAEQCRTEKFADVRKIYV